LALALALDRFGIRSLVVERSATTTDHPKSRGCWVRTMEIFRQWGVEDAIRARGLADGTDVFAMVERLTGREYGRTRSEPRGDQSPTWKSMVAQDAVEEELLRAVQKGAHASVRYSTEMLDFEDLGSSVRVRVRDMNDGTVETWETDWLIGADGAGSGTRRAAGIDMDGPPMLADSVGQSLGFIYDAGALIRDGSTRPAYNPRVYTPIDRPGGRFPHRWMDAARTETTLDWFDQEFVLVTGTEGDAWLEAGADVARRLRVPLGLKRWPASHEAALEVGCGMGRRGAVLVRPDGHVAWRMAWCPPDPKAELASAMTTLLAGTVAAHPAMAWR
jgi:2-polyprenyl-6-methoxyphenol hydroxylase-like FAD-dependent oxidoreductase